MAGKTKKSVKTKARAKPKRWSCGKQPARGESHAPQAGIQQPPKWTSWKLKKRTLLPLLVITIGLIGGLVTLLVLSNVWHGVVPVENKTSSFGHISWKLSLTWTTLPAVIFQIYGLCVAAVVDAFGFRQPFVELARKKGVSAGKSIALDYQSFFPIQKEYKAARRGHWHLFPAFLLSLVLSVVLGPLAAHMLVEHAYTRVRNVSLAQNYSLYSTSTLDEPLGWDLSPVIGGASSTLVYGGTYPPWSNGSHVFLNFSSPALPGGAISQPMVNAMTQAYFAMLDCQAMSDVAAHITREVDANSEDGNAGRWFLNGTDRECDWRTSLQISQDFITYLQTSSNTTCGAFGDYPHSGRLIIVAASDVDFNETLPTVVTCIPTYWTSRGSLSVNLDADSRSPILGFNGTERTELRPQWWNSFEYQLNQVESIDTTTNGGTQSDSATSFGRVILDNARRNHAASPLAPDALINSSQQVYATTYSLLVNDFMIRATSSSNSTQGELSYSTNRLFVYTAVASTIIGLLTAVAVLLVAVLVYTGRHTSILFEEPVGMIGRAGVLANSVVNSIAAAIRGTDNYQGQTIEKTMEVFGPGAKDTPGFIAIDMDDPRSTHIGLCNDRIMSKEAAEAFVERHFPPKPPPIDQQSTGTPSTQQDSLVPLQPQAPRSPTRQPSDSHPEPSTAPAARQNTVQPDTQGNPSGPTGNSG